MSLPPASRSKPDLAALWAARGIDAGAVQPDSRGTIGRSALRVAETLAARPMAVPSTTSAEAHDLELGPIIGRGGMGVVRLATQRALKRTVAVKQVLDPSDEVVAALLREAWIAGNLEHPNILPIHTLASPVSGPPLLVMKRIEGLPWTQVLADATVAPGEAGIEDPLEWHLRVFTRVCRAVHFAHAQGIVHLDIKPDNVMLGRFGEVYLVDWGLAASLDPQVPAWMPRAADIKTVVGTPAYMAPELALAAGARIDARTDVYLLGAVLFEIITGQRLHTGTVLEAVTSAWRSEAPALPDVPTELAQICRRAVAREPADRFESVEALRLEVESFLQHRHATGLADEALDRLARLEARLAEGSDAEVQRLIDECRFGLRLALRAWPGQARARAGLARLLRHVAERHRPATRSRRRGRSSRRSRPRPPSWSSRSRPGRRPWPSARRRWRPCPGITI
ncbi:MAG: serine/threonine-protein kinase [bacterium]